MWKSLLFALLCQIAAVWSEHHLRHSDLGKSVNIFQNFAFDDTPAQVTFDDSRDWIDRLSKKTFLKNGTFRFKALTWRPSKLEGLYMNFGERSLTVCDNLEALLKTFFNYIQVLHVSEFADALSQTPKLFTEFSNLTDIANKFDIPEEYLRSDDYTYVLVKHSLTRHKALIQTKFEQLQPENDIQSELDKITENKSGPILSFIKKYGSHYIDDYETGILLYQVFVYDKNEFAAFDDKLRYKEVQNLEESQIKYLSPKYAKRVGSILSLDRNSSIEAWAAEVCIDSYYPIEDDEILTLSTNPVRFNSLLRLDQYRYAMREFQHKAQNGTLIQIRLYSILNVIKNETQREWFHDVFVNKFPEFFKNVYFRL